MSTGSPERRAFDVTEMFVRSKTGDERDGEDVVRDGADFTVLADGATDKFGVRVDGVSGGRAAAELVCDVVAAATSGTSGHELVEAINAAYRERFGAVAGALPDRARPTAVFCAVDKPARRVIRVGDTSWRSPDQVHLGSKRIDRITADARAALLRCLLAEGVPQEELLATDPGRELILPLLRHQAALRNHPRVTALTYAGIDGHPVPSALVEEWHVDAEVIVLASDGYPRLFLTLAECEDYLAADLVRDPLRIGRHATTKAVSPGQVSFDDRAFARLELAASSA